MKRFDMLIILVSILTAVSGCGGGGGDSGTATVTTSVVSTSPMTTTTLADPCSIREQNKFVYVVMKTSYLWYDKVPNTDYTAYSSPETLLEALKYKPLDRWSYITPKEAYYAYFEEGTYIGLGFSLRRDAGFKARIGYVYKSSPAYRAGLKRSDTITAINGKTIAEIDHGNLWNTVLGPDQIGVVADLTVETSDGSERIVSLIKETISIHTVIHDEIFTVNGRKIGYIVFVSFINPSVSELDAVFSAFKIQGVTELILDLRYNGGGRGSIAEYLASLIGGDYTNGKVFAQYLHNANYSGYDHTDYFEKPSSALNLSRVIIITGSSTCSASELVINSLTPYIQVITVGSVTCGKPVGMYGHDYCDIHLSPIEFRVVNALGEGDYYYGMTPDCFSEDELSKSFGDRDEDSLKEAMHVLTQGGCTNRVKTFRMEQNMTAIPLEGFKAEIGAF